MSSPLDLDLTAGARPGKAPVPGTAARAAAPRVTSPLDLDLALTGNAPPTPGQQARAAWAQTPEWKRLGEFALHGVNNIGAGLESILGVNPRGPLATRFDRAVERATGQGKPYPRPVINALERQHPGYNYGVKWPAEFAASMPLGEAAGALAGGVAGGLAPKVFGELPEGASLGARALAALPRSMATGAAYGVQQPTGHPLENAAIGALTMPLFEGALHGGATLAGGAAKGIENLWNGLTKPVLDDAAVDQRVGEYLRKLGAPESVTPRSTPEGVALPTAVHANDPTLLDLQGKERASTRAVPFNELAAQNNAAILQGMRGRLAPNADQGSISTAAHDLLQSAQARGRAAVRAAYAPFDAIKGGVYLEPGPVQKALGEAYGELLPTHQKMLPDEVRQVLEADRPLSLKNDIENLGARLSDAIGNTPPGTPASRALMMMRDALNKGAEDSPLANQPQRGALTYEAARASLPARNMAASDPAQDSILEWLAKHPQGISSEEALAQGLDPADLRSRLARVGIRRAFRQGGMSFDAAAEALHQAGYPVADAQGNYDPNVLLNSIDSELRGRPVYSVANTRQGAELAHEAAMATPATREPPDLTDLAHRAMQADPGTTQALLDGWTDDNPETLSRVQQGLRAIAEPPQAAEPITTWQTAKETNRQFRERFPQGTARDTEARSWLANWLTGGKEPTKFLSEAANGPRRSQAVLDAFEDPAEREQMRQLMVNHYTNRLIGLTNQGVPGLRTLNAPYLSLSRMTNAPLERVILNPDESDALDNYVRAAHDNAKITQRTMGGSSETASLLGHQAGKTNGLLGSGIVHAAAKIHPAVGALAHALLPDAASEGTADALQGRLTSSLLDPAVYNRVMGTAQPTPGLFRKLMQGGAQGALALGARAPAVALPVGLVPGLSGVR
jgi:hypothetical protein